MIWRRRNQADADTRHVARIAISAGLLCALVQPTMAMARETESFTCTLTDQVRRIERVFEPGGAPCTVEYYRNDQPPRTMWRAKETGSVCVDGVRKMIQDFRAAGYSCTGAPTEPAAGVGAGVGESRPAATLCYALTYEACGPGGGNCDMKPASICAQPDNRWLMTDGVPGDLDPLTRFLPGDPGKCYRVYREGQPRPLCTEVPGSPNTVWSLR